MTNDEKNNNLLEQIIFLKSCSYLEQDLRGYSSALRYICEKDGQKYFVKIYENNRLNDLDYVESIYIKLEIPTAKIIAKDYLQEFNKTYVIYEYIEGKTLLEMTQEIEIDALENIGKRVGNYLSRFKKITTNKEKLIYSFDIEFQNLIDKLYYTKEYYNKNEKGQLEFINLDRLCKNFNEYKKYIYNTEPTFIHKDINLNNVIVNNNETYFIDTDGGNVSFRALDYRGICWWTWDGENKLKEQAIYRGIFKGLFDGNIPDDFHKEIAFTIMYEFLLKVEEISRSKDMRRMEYIFSKFGDIFNQTNYFEDYKFAWFD